MVDLLLCDGFQELLDVIDLLQEQPNTIDVPVALLESITEIMNCNDPGQSIIAQVQHYINQASSPRKT